MEAQIATLVTRALEAGDAPGLEADPTRGRILDAALGEAASVGLDRVTLEGVARRAGIGRMTLYRRYALREELIDALLVRETRSFLESVALGIGSSDDPDGRVAGSFVAAMRFVREHPLLKRLAHSEPGGVVDTVAAGDAVLLRMGSEFLAAQIQSERPSASPKKVRRIADVMARLFLTYVALPPTDPDPYDDAQLHEFAASILAPLASLGLDD